jgi:hypothetical protein
MANFGDLHLDRYYLIRHEIGGDPCLVTVLLQTEQGILLREYLTGKARLF